ncbi:MAG: hypothetical protein JSR80_06495 [Verrucomicrobia bacterium]|nr:hypothetical protein [Verrucomicrobiota bacterium]
MEIENQELPAPAPSSQISYGSKALALFLAALVMQNFAITNKKLLRFALVTGSLGGAVWMTSKALYQVFVEESVNSTKVATGLKKGDLVTLNELIKRSPFPGQRSLFAETLDQYQINFLHDELMELDHTIQKVLESDSKSFEFSRGGSSVSKSADSPYLTLEVHEYRFWRVKGTTLEQCRHLLYGYCQVRSDLFKATQFPKSGMSQSKKHQKHQLYLYPVAPSLPHNNSSCDHCLIEQPLPEGTVATAPLFQGPPPLEERDLKVFNCYLEAGGGVKIGAFPEGKEEEIKKIYTSMREVSRYLDGSLPSNENSREIRVGGEVWIKLVSPRHGEPQGRKGVTFPALPEDLFLSKEQLKALFLGQMAEHKDHLGIQSRNLPQGGYLLWEKKGVAEVYTRKQFLEIKETKAVWEQIQESLKVTKEEWNQILEKLQKGELRPDPWFTPLDGGDIEITFKSVVIKKENYLILGHQRIHCPKENVYQILVGCVTSQDFPGIGKVEEIEKGVKYRLIRKNKI